LSEMRLHELDPLLEPDVLDDGSNEILFRGEMLEDERFANAGASSQLPGGGPMEPLLREDLEGRGQDLGAPIRGL